MSKSTKVAEDRLLAAIRANDLRRVEELLKQDCKNWFSPDVPRRDTFDVNLLNCYERSPLHLAAELGRAEIVDLLLKAGCRVNWTDNENTAPIHLATRRGNKDVIEKLLAAGCQINSKTSDKSCALHIAASRGFSEVTEILIAHGAKVDVLDAADRTPLMLGANRGHHDVVKILLKHGAKVNLEEIHGYTPLAEAVWQKDAALVRLLLEAGARVTKSHFLLHYSVLHRKFQLVALLLQFGCLVNLRDDNGDTPLHIAVRTGEIDIVDILLRHGANVNYPNMVTGSSPLHEAVQDLSEFSPQTFIAILDRLIAAGCNLNAESYNRGDFPLYRAISLEKFHIAAALIRAGCDVNKGHVDVVSCSNVDNLCLARRSNNLRIARLLVYAGFQLQRAHWLEVLPTAGEPFEPADECGIKDFLVHCKTNPLKLIHLCRISIRQSLGTNVRRKINALTLPNRMTKYLLLEDEP